MSLEAYLQHSKGPAFRRTPRRNLEEGEQAALTSAASLRWWWPGYRHHMPERQNRGEAWRGKSLGVKPGWPDVTLHVPAMHGEDLTPSFRERRPPVLVALELKVGSNRPTADQLNVLSLLEAVGYRCGVFWSWEEALQFLDDCAGPTPAKLPEGW